MTNTPSQSESKPRPLFIYGNLRSLPLLAWLLTGDPSNISAVSKLRQPAIIRGYERGYIKDTDYPAAFKSNSKNWPLDGYLLLPETTSQRDKLDHFEPERFLMEPVTVTVGNVHLDGNRRHLEKEVEADVYIWGGGLDALTSSPRGNLAEIWLDLYKKWNALREQGIENIKLEYLIPDVRMAWIHGFGRSPRDHLGRLYY
ncbi:hypothetical protein FHL15_004798 [Xylaria flabelliformis]|uniref:Putative gamma-glutamylcyclotransferase n=1 Tax=Xylaria flabelliformis TaxID=2512241 RepID=A0A553I2A6_9PEZI|nr:hypothetical protein FHL15_004798 [Xylaria flabelliformis]